MYAGRKRRDKNQSAIVRVLRRLGCSVIITADVGGGFPDLVVGYGGVTYLVEVKNRTKLSESQVAFREAWRGGPIWVLYSVEDAIEFVKHISGGKDAVHNPRAQSRNTDSRAI